MRTSLSAVLTAALLSTALSAQAVSAPCFVANFGTNLNLGDDQVAQNNALGFTFPGPGTTSVTSIDISSNGFVWLGSNTDTGCCDGDLTDFLTNTARIAAMWSDLDPGTAGGVWFNTFPATPSSLASAVVTWDGVPEYGESRTFTMQLQLFSDGSFAIAWDPDAYNYSHNCITGVTEGISASANAVDLSSATTTSPYTSNGNPTIHEEQLGTFDLASKSLVFTRNGTGGYIVIDRPACTFASARPFGAGCPKPGVAYELFSNPNSVDLSNRSIDFIVGANGSHVGIPGTAFFTGYTNSFPFQDDEVVGPFNLPFTFAFPGGSTNAIDISSNGFVWLSTGNPDPRCCDGDPFLFLLDPASIAALWQDLDPTSGGNIYYDVAPSGTEVHVTWVAVPEYGTITPSPNTAQITLRSDGSFRLAWQTVDNQFHTCLVGFSQGNGASDPGSVDFSNLVLFGAGGTPLKLAAQSGSRPALGTTFTMNVDQIASGSLLGVMAFGFLQFVPGIDLSGIGMIGCELNVSLDALLSFAVTGNPTPYSFGVPNVTSLVGFLFHAQAATLTPGANALNLLASNGLEITLGN